MYYKTSCQYHVNLQVWDEKLALWNSSLDTSIQYERHVSLVAFKPCQLTCQQLLNEN